MIRPKLRLPATLDTPEWVFKGGFCACVINTKISSSDEELLNYPAVNLLILISIYMITVKYLLEVLLEQVPLGPSYDLSEID